MTYPEGKLLKDGDKDGGEFRISIPPEDVEPLST
jgi:hypothetical protein